MENMDGINKKESKVIYLRDAVKRTIQYDNFFCVRNLLASLNVIYVVVGIVLVGVAAYAKAVAVITTLQVMSGIIACGVLLLIISLIGFVGAMRHHQVTLFFYMLILLLLFVVQFSVACACLALSDTQQQRLFRLGWQNAAPALKDRTQDLFNCCGFNISTQGLVEPDDPFSHPLCNQMTSCHGRFETTCCSGIQPGNGTRMIACPIADCWKRVEPNLKKAVRVVGGLGLFFSLLEIFGVWLTYRYRKCNGPGMNHDSVRS